MYFDSFADFIAMGGHGAYVWAAYGIAAAVLVALVMAPLRRRRQFWIEQTMRDKRERASARAQTNP